MSKNISTTRTDSLPADLRKKASIVEDVNPFVEFPSLRSVAEWLLVDWRFYVHRYYSYSYSQLKLFVRVFCECNKSCTMIKL